MKFGCSKAATSSAFSASLIRDSWWCLQMVFKRKHRRHPNKKLKKLKKLNVSMKAKKSNTMTLDQFKDKHFGERGTTKREQLEAGYANFKIGALLHEARLEKGLTQEELAEKVGTTKSYISKIENDVKEVRISTLQKIVEVGLGGRVQLSIKL